MSRAQRAVSAYRQETQNFNTLNRGEIAYLDKRIKRGDRYKALLDIWEIEV